MAEDVVIRTIITGLSAVQRGLSSIEGHANKLDRAFTRVGRAVESFGGGMSRAGRNIALGLTLPMGLAAGVVARFGINAVESENLFNVSMGKMADEARKFTDALSKNLGLNQFEVRNSIGTFNVMLKSMVGNREAAFEMAKGLTRLTHDMASFFNLRPEEAFQKLQAGITGEIEPLKRLGITIKDVTIEATAMRLGLIQQGQEMNEAQKVIARYITIIDATKAAQGDLARTMDSPANMLRRLRARIEEAATVLSVKLVPIMQQLLGVAGTVVDRITAATQRFASLSLETQTAALKIGLLIAAVGPALFIVGKLIQAFGLLIIAGGKVAKVFALIASGLALLATPLVAAAAAVTAIAVGIADLFFQFEAATGGAEKFVKVLDSIGAAAERLFKSLDDLAENKFSKVATAAVGAGERLFGMFLNNARKISESAAGALERMMGRTEARAASTSGKITQFFGETFETVPAVAEKSGNKLREVMDSVWRAASRVTDDMTVDFSAFTADVEASLSDIPVFAELAGEGMAKEVAKASQDMAKAVGAGSIGITEALKLAFEQASSFSKKEFEKISKLAQQDLQLAIATTEHKIRIGKAGSEEMIDLFENAIKQTEDLQKKQLASLNKHADQERKVVEQLVKDEEITREEGADRIRAILDQAARDEEIVRRKTAMEIIQLQGRVVDSYEDGAARQLDLIRSEGFSRQRQMQLLQALANSYRGLGDSGAAALRLIESEMQLLQAQTSRTFGQGALAAVSKYFDGLRDHAGRAETFVTNSVLRPMEDALTDFFATGEVSWEDFFNSVKTGLARLAAQSVIEVVGGAVFGGAGGGGGKGLLGGLLGSIGSSVGSAIGSSDFFSGIGDFFSDLLPFAHGGQVRGPGSQTSDSIMARLSDGEFVVNAASAKRWLPLLEAINTGRLPGYAQGGEVSMKDVFRFGLEKGLSQMLSSAVSGALGLPSFNTALGTLAGSLGLTASLGGGIAGLGFGAGTIGSIGAQAAVFPSVGVAAAGLAGALPTLGISLIASLLVSKLLGGLLEKETVGPNAAARIRVGGGRAFLGPSGADNGGQLGIAEQMANAAISMVNALSAISGQPIRGTTGTVIGYFPKEGGAFAGSGGSGEEGRRYFGDDANAAIQYAVDALLGKGVLNARTLTASQRQQASRLGEVGALLGRLPDSARGIAGAPFALFSSLLGAFSELSGVGGGIMSRVAGMQTGGSRIFSRPTLLSVAETGPERVEAQPLGGARAPGNGAGGVNVFISGPAVFDDISMTRFVRSISVRGGQSSHARVILGRGARYYA